MIDELTYELQCRAECGGEKRELILDVPPGGSAAVGYDGLEITVAKVEPEAHSQRRIAAEDYVVTLVVERSADRRGSPSNRPVS